MSNLLEILSRGLVAELTGALRDRFEVDESITSKELRDAVQREPQCPDHLRRLGARSLDESNATRARHCFEAALQANASDAVAMVGLACALEQTGNIDEAVTVLQRARWQKPKDAAVLFALGYCYERLGQVDQALGAYTASIEGHPPPA